jgi:hypothetical protein
MIAITIAAKHQIASSVSFGIIGCKSENLGQLQQPVGAVEVDGEGVTVV